MIPKYLFSAYFADGTIIELSYSDKSTAEPETRNAYYDVLEKQKTSKLTKFELKSADNLYLVSLIDGHFRVNGVPFFMHEPYTKNNPDGTVEIIPVTEFRLVYFKQHQHDVQMTNGEPTQTAHRVTYHFGWQTTVDGSNIERVMKLL